MKKIKDLLIKFIKFMRPSFSDVNEMLSQFCIAVFVMWIFSHNVLVNFLGYAAILLSFIAVCAHVINKDMKGGDNE